MDTKTLECMIKCDRELSSCTTGVFASDRIPHKPTFYPYAFIANTQKHTLLGQHWIAIFVPTPAEGEFFDSFAEDPSYYSKQFQDFFSKNNLKLKVNNKRIQSDKSVVCGEYCIYYLLNRSRQVSMETLMSLFSPNYINNDVFIRDYIKDVFPLCLRA